MALSGVRSSWLICARKRDLAILAASARRRASSEIDFDLLEFADQRVLFGARLERGQRGRIEPVGEQREIALCRQRHDGKDVVVQRALQREIERDRDR